MPPLRKVLAKAWTIASYAGFELEALLLTPKRRMMFDTRDCPFPIFQYRALT